MKWLWLFVATVALAELRENVALLVTKETTTEIVDDGSAITTNVTDRYIYNTAPNLPKIAYRSALAGFATNTPSATVSNAIAQDVAQFYRQLGVAVGNVEVRMPQ